MDTNPSNNLKSKGTYSSLSHEEKMERYNIDHKTAKIVIILAILIDVFGFTMILPLLPFVAQNTFGASNFQIGLIIASNAFMTLIFAPLWGKLSDKYGSKPFLLISQFGTFVAFLILGFADSLFLILVSRILDGVFGGQIPIIRAYFADITDSDTRSTEIGKITGIVALGVVIGPAIGGLLGVINWRYPAFLACILSVITIMLTAKFLVESMPKQRILDLRQRRAQIKEERKKKVREVFTKIVMIRLLELFLVFLTFMIFLSSLPLVLVLKFGLNIFMIGLMFSLFGLSMVIIGGVVMKPVNERIGEKMVLLFTLFLAIGIFCIFPFISSAWLLYLFIIPFVFCQIFIRTILSTNLTKAVEEDKQGVVSGWATNIQSIAQIIAPLLAYWYLEIGYLEVGSVLNLNSYFLIGLTCAMIIVILIFIVLIDMRKYPQAFSQQKTK